MGGNDPLQIYVRQLTDYDRQILALLDADHGKHTREIATHVRPQFGHSARTHSGAVRSWLERLERRGMVRRLEVSGPTEWIKIEERSAPS